MSFPGTFFREDLFTKVVKEFPVIFSPRTAVAQHCIGFINQTGCSVIAAQVRVILQVPHEGAIACADNFNRRIRLDLQYAVIVSSVYHG